MSKAFRHTKTRKSGKKSSLRCYSAEIGFGIKEIMHSCPAVLVFYGFEQAHDVPEFYSGVGGHVGVLQNFVKN